MDELQLPSRKIVAQKPEFKKKVNEVQKQQFVHHLSEPYFTAVA